jgi:glycine cleavage system H protein
VIFYSCFPKAIIYIILPKLTKEESMDLPRDLVYTKEHEWVRREGNTAIIGITDYAQKELGDVVYVELPSKGDEVKCMEPFGVIESVKAVSDLYSPISGKVIESNDELPDHPEWVNEDPYGNGWMIKVAMSEPDELDSHLLPEQYGTFVEEEAGD